MNKQSLILYITLVILFLNTTFSFGQCVVCVEAPPLITCGETATLTGDGFLTTAGFSDNFNSPWNSAILWTNISTGGGTSTSCTSAPTAFSNCAGGGVVPAGDHLWFPQGAAVPRNAQTIGIPVPAGGDIIFEYKMEVQSAAGCDGPDLIGEGTMVQYRVPVGTPVPGAGVWQDVPAFMSPFDQNPIPYTNKAYFCPTNPQLQSFTSWNQYTIPIPANAFSAATQFRWRQISPTSQNWDFWGLENVNIVPSSPGGATYTWSPGGAGQTLNVSPTSLTNYTFTYDNNGISCSTTVVVDVAAPIAYPVIVPNPLNPCPNAIDLNANVSFNSCNYNIYLYDNGGDGWTTIPQTTTSIDNRIEVYIDGVLVNTITMNGGYGPIVYSIPVTAGGTFETVFLTGGPNPSECVYFIEDNQGQLITDLTGNIISAMGLITSPSSPWWPVPGTVPPSGGFAVQPGNFGPVNTVCPTTNPYTYSWSISPGGSIAGISTPNSQSTVVTTASTQDYQVVATDVNNPGCIATGLVNVIGSGGSWDFTNISPNPACEGDCIDLNFTSTVGGSANYNIVVEMIDASGSNSWMYTIDNNGNNIATPGVPIELCPTISAAITNVSFNILSLVDASDPNNCEIPITNTSQVVTFATQPNAGTNDAITVCETNGFFDLYSILGGNPDLGGTWTNSAGTVLGSSFFNPATTGSDNFTYTVGGGPCPIVSAIVAVTNNALPDAGQNAGHIVCENDAAFNMYNFLGGTPQTGGSWTDASGGSVVNMFDPSTMSSGVFTYTVLGLVPCPSRSANLNVTVNPLPSAGMNGPHTVCEDDPVFNLFNYLTGSPDVGGIWTDVNNIPVSNIFNPSTMSSGVFTYTVLGIPCTTPITANVTVTVNPLPTVIISGNATITQGMSTLITFTFTGSAPFTVTYNDGTGPITSPSFNSTTGTITVTPNTTTTYTLVSVDDNGCPASVSGSVTITVNQLPTVTLTLLGNAIICVGQNSDLDFNLGGSPNFTVEYNIIDINNPSGVLNSYIFNSTGSNILNVSPVITTTYTLVSITDGNGVVDNTLNGSVTITVNPLPTAVLSGNNTICDGLQSPLNFTLTGAANYTLTYNPGGIVVTLNASGNDATSGNPVMVNPNATTVYSIVSVMDANGCNNGGSGSPTITVNPLPTISIGGTTPICAGQSSNLSFTLSGTAPYIVNYLIGSNSANVTLDAAGTIGGTPLSITPNNTTTYTLVDVTDANSCSATSNASITIEVNPLPTATISGSTSICIGQSTALGLSFTGTGPYNVNYNINSTPTFAVLNNNIDSIVFSSLSATTTFTLIDVTDAYCSNTANGTVIVTVNPLPSATISGGATLCADGSTAQIDIIANGSAPFNVIYSDGFNNVVLPPISSSHNFNTTTAGTYTLSSITDVNGCSGNVYGVAIVVVNPLPVANFSFMPQPIDINNPTIYFTDLSSGHIAGIYDFGDGTTVPSVLLGQLQHTFLDTGSYQVLYSVTSIDGCTATVVHTIIIDPAFLIYIPTAFTPNRDGKNDIFIPIMMGIDEYNFYIYDRFGELIFETENQLEGWNGRAHGNEFALAGHYAYTVQILDLLGKRRSFTGTLTLIR